MKTVGLALFCAWASPTFAGDVAVSVGVGQPGFYGQISIGNAPPPQLVYLQPVIIQRAPEFASAAPIYLRVPPGHEKHWRHHCGEYNACGRPVYFVRDDWYRNEYVPHYRQHEGGDQGDYRHGQHHDRNDGHEDDHVRQDR